MINKLFILTLSLAVTANINNATQDYVNNINQNPSVLNLDNFTPRLNQTTNKIYEVRLTFDNPVCWDYIDMTENPQTIHTYTTSVIILNNNATNTNVMEIIGDGGRAPLFTINRSTAYYSIFDTHNHPYKGMIRYQTSAKNFKDVSFNMHQVSVGRYVNIEHITQYANAYNSVYYDTYFNTGSTGSKTLIDGVFSTSYGFFNSINIVYINAYASRYYDGGVKKVENPELVYPTMISYKHLYNGVTEVVANANYIRKAIPDTTGEQYIYSGGLSWTNLDYSNIYLYTFNINIRSTLGQLTNTNGLQNLLWSPNEINTLGGSFGTSGNILTNTFALFKGAFESVTSFFSMQIFPGISVGLLIFLPFIGGLIVVLVKVFKK